MPLPPPSAPSLAFRFDLSEERAPAESVTAKTTMSAPASVINKWNTNMRTMANVRANAIAAARADMNNKSVSELQEIWSNKYIEYNLAKLESKDTRLEL